MPGAPFKTKLAALAVGHGSLWVGHDIAGAVYRLDQETGVVVAEIKATSPSRVLIDGDAVWLTSYSRGVVERIDPSTNEVVDHIEVGGNANGLAIGFDALWVADTRDGRILRLSLAG